MRVLLIRPPARHTVESEVPEAVEAENLSYPPLALLSLAAFLRDQSHHVCDILDAQLDHLTNEEMEAQFVSSSQMLSGLLALQHWSMSRILFVRS